MQMVMKPKEAVAAAVMQRKTEDRIKQKRGNESPLPIISESTYLMMCIMTDGRYSACSPMCFLMAAKLVSLRPCSMRQASS